MKLAVLPFHQTAPINHLLASWQLIPVGICNWLLISIMSSMLSIICLNVPARRITYKNLMIEIASQQSKYPYIKQTMNNFPLLLIVMNPDINASLGQLSPLLPYLLGVGFRGQFSCSAPVGWAVVAQADSCLLIISVVAGGYVNLLINWTPMITDCFTGSVVAGEYINLLINWVSVTANLRKVPKWCYIGALNYNFGHLIVIFRVILNVSFHTLHNEI